MSWLSKTSPVDSMEVYRVSAKPGEDYGYSTNPKDPFSYEILINTGQDKVKKPSQTLDAVSAVFKLFEKAGAKDLKLDDFHVMSVDMSMPGSALYEEKKDVISLSVTVPRSQRIHVDGTLTLNGDRHSEPVSIKEVKARTAAIREL